MKTNNSFYYHSHYGTVFESNLDLSYPLVITRPDYVSEEQFVADCIEMGAMHALNTRPTLNVFAGYDTVTPVINTLPHE